MALPLGQSLRVPSLGEHLRGAHAVSLAVGMMFSVLHRDSPSVAALSPQHSPGPAHLRDLLELVVALAALLCCLQCDFVVVHKGLVDPQLAGLQGAGVSWGPGGMLKPPGSTRGQAATEGTLPRAVPSRQDALPDHSQLRGHTLGSVGTALAQDRMVGLSQNPAKRPWTVEAEATAASQHPLTCPLLLPSPAWP